MATARKKAPQAAPKRRKTAAKRTTTATASPRRRRRTTTKKRGLGDLMTRNEAQAGFNQLIGIAAGYAGSAILGKFLNPEGEKDKLEIMVKIAAGFLVSTTARMPSVGGGIMANGVAKLLEVNANLGDQGFLNDILPGKKTNYLSQGTIKPTGVYMADYTAAYQSQNY
jgi:hypothetical protein